MSLTKTGQLLANNFYEDNGNNLLSNISWINGHYYGDTGKLTNSDNMKYIEEYIPIINNMKYTITITDTSSNHIRIHEYDNDFTWIKQGVDTTTKTKTWVTQPNTAFIRIALPKNSTDITLIKDSGFLGASITSTQNIIGTSFYEY